MTNPIKRIFGLLFAPVSLLIISLFAIAFFCRESALPVAAYFLWGTDGLFLAVCIWFAVKLARVARALEVGAI